MGRGAKRIPPAARPRGASGPPQPGRPGHRPGTGAALGRAAGAATGTGTARGPAGTAGGRTGTRAGGAMAFAGADGEPHRNADGGSPTTGAGPASRAPGTGMGVCPAGPRGVSGGMGTGATPRDGTGADPRTGPALAALDRNRRGPTVLGAGKQTARAGTTGAATRAPRGRRTETEPLAGLGVRNVTEINHSAPGARRIARVWVEDGRRHAHGNRKAITGRTAGHDGGAAAGRHRGTEQAGATGSSARRGDPAGAPGGWRNGAGRSSGDADATTGGQGGRRSIARKELERRRPRGDESARDGQPAPAGEGDASHAGRREVGRAVERHPTHTRLEMGDGGGRLHRRRHHGAQLAGVGRHLVATERDRAIERGHRPAQAAGRRAGEAQRPDQAGEVRRALVRVCRSRPGRI